jgi:hypothetical protein
MIIPSSRNESGSSSAQYRWILSKKLLISLKHCQLFSEKRERKKNREGKREQKETSTGWDAQGIQRLQQKMPCFFLPRLMIKRE